MVKTCRGFQHSPSHAGVGDCSRCCKDGRNLIAVSCCCKPASLMCCAVLENLNARSCGRAPASVAMSSSPAEHGNRKLTAVSRLQQQRHTAGTHVLRYCKAPSATMALYIYEAHHLMCMLEQGCPVSIVCKHGSRQPKCGCPVLHSWQTGRQSRSPARCTAAE